MHDEVAAGAGPGDFLVEVEPVVDAGADAVLAGDAEDIRRRRATYAAAGVTDLVLTFVGPDPLADMAYLLRASPP